MNLYVIRAIGSKQYFVEYHETQMRFIWSKKPEGAKEWYTRQAARDAFAEILAKYHPNLEMAKYYEVVPVKYSCKVTDMSDYRYRG